MIKPKRTLCIGDIHGGLKALKQVLERCKFSYNEDKLIFLGDYIDGGVTREYAELIQYLIELDQICNHKPIFLRGNHDKWCQDWLVMGAAHKIWVEQGGRATMKSYIDTGFVASIEHKFFFQNLVNYYIDEDNNGFVHGGFTSLQGLGHETYEDDYYWDRDMWTQAVTIDSRNPGDLPYTGPGRMYKHKHIFIGHSQTLYWNVKPNYPEYNDPNQPKNGSIVVPMTRCNVTNVDTGAGGPKGRLTIMDIHSREYWQSDTMSTFYPEDKGR